MNSSWKDSFILIILICFTKEAVSASTTSIQTTSSTTTDFQTTQPATTFALDTTTTTVDTTATTVDSTTAAIDTTTTQATTITQPVTTATTVFTTTTEPDTATTAPDTTTTQPVTTVTAVDTTTTTPDTTTTASDTTTTAIETTTISSETTTTPPAATATQHATTTTTTLTELTATTTLPTTTTNAHETETTVTTTTTDTTSTPEEGTNAGQSDNGDTKVPVVGAVVGALAVAAVAVVAAALCFMYGKRRQKMTTSKAINDEMEGLDGPGAADDQVRNDRLDTGKPNPNPYSNVRGIGDIDGTPRQADIDENNYSSLHEDAPDTPIDQSETSFGASKRKPERIDTEHVYTSLDQHGMTTEAKGDKYVNVPIRQAARDGEHSDFTNMDTRRDADADPHLYTTLIETTLL